MLPTREILTLQFGSYSNYIGTHFWNIQETSFDYTGQIASEIDHDVLYREGVNINKQTTYTPRLLLVDLKSNFGGLATENDVYANPTTSESASTSSIWPDDQIAKIEAPQYEYNQLQKDLKAFNEAKQLDYKLDTQIRTWTDFLYPQLHPRTINSIGDQNLTETNGFSHYDQGCQLWSTANFNDDFCDKIRQYAEECETLQGFQVIFDATTAFSGLALSCMEHLQDEYINKSIFAMPVIKTDLSANDSSNDPAVNAKFTRGINFLLSCANLIEYSTLFVPLSIAENFAGNSHRKFQNLRFDPLNNYHSSAIIASAIDTFSLSYRKRSVTTDMLDVCRDLSGNSRKMASASVSLPFAIKEKQFLIETLNEWGESPSSGSSSSATHLLECITPSCTLDEDHMLQLVNLRGIPNELLKAPQAFAGKQRELQAYSCKSIKEMLELFFASQYVVSGTQVNTFNSPLKIHAPYPQFFESNVSQFGFLSENTNADGVSCVPVMSGMHSGRHVGRMLKELHDQVKNIRMSRLRKAYPNLQDDELSESLNKVMEQSDNYEPDWGI